LADRTIMGWSKLRALVASGMDVQSHSHSHLVLNTLTPAAVVEDLACSWRALRDELGVDAHAIAYPVGYELDPERRRAVLDAGFELGFTNDTGVGSLDRLDRLAMPRVSMDLSLGGAAYKLRLAIGGRRAARWAPEPGARASP